MTSREIKQRYLIENGDKVSLPMYENSFYFYFGLKDGSTALDEFKKQFFSECESNNIAKTPTITVIEKIDKETFFGEANIVIDNMLPTYTITIKDNTTGEEFGPISTDDDSFKMTKYVDTAATEGLTIGHEYTITVTDSIDQTTTKTFVFGSSAVKVDAESVNFRIAAQIPPPRGSGLSEAKNGGFIRINNVATILKQIFTIDGTDPETGEPAPDKKVIFKFSPAGANSWTDLPNTSYKDMSDEKWFIFYVPMVGQYDVAIQYKGKTVSIFTVTIDDNTKINLYVSCDYLCYKPDAGKPFYNNRGTKEGLKDIKLNEWLNNANIFKSLTPGEVEPWLMRHTFYRHTPNDKLAYDNYIYTKGNYEIAIFGQPEKGNLITRTEKMAGTFFKNDYSHYAGYSVEDGYMFYPTIYWDGTAEAPTVNTEDAGRKMFDAMAISDDGRAAADASNSTLSTYNYSNGFVTVTGSLDGVINDKHGCIVVFENGAILYGVKNGGTITGYSSYNIYENGYITPDGTNLLNMATVYPTLLVPTIYKPSYADVSAATWNVQTLVISTDEDGETIAEKRLLPLSYKVEGDVFNALTYNDRFSAGSSTSSDGVEKYETYLMFNNENNFWTGLTNNANGGLVPEISTVNRDQSPNIAEQSMFEFGAQHQYWSKSVEQKWPLTYDPNNWATGNVKFAFGREIVKDELDTYGNSTIRDVEEFAYCIKEGAPNPTSLPENALTERYDGGEFDLIKVNEKHPIIEVFPEEIKLKAYEANNGIEGKCALYTESNVPKEAKYYVSNTAMFDIGPGPMEIVEDNQTFYHGVYNHKIKNDVKGSPARVTKEGPNYFYSVTQDNGSKIQKRVNIGNLIGDNRNAKREGELKLYESGITLSHQYQLKKEYRRDVKLIKGVVQAASPVTFSTPGGTGDIFTGTQRKTLISVYEKPADGTKNKLVVYKLWPIESLDIIYPLNPGGIEPYLQANSGNTYSKEAQTITITISTNVKFSGQTGANWVKFSVNNQRTAEFDSTVTSISLNIDAIPESDNNDRCTTVTLGCIEPGVEITSDNRDKLTATINICQTRDEIKEVKEELEDEMSDMYTDLEGQIQELSGNTGNGGTSGGGN
jgi:hypothetical protein